ncbi:MAG: hypothetical protein COV30_01940 [Candidatus Yanofskybacteria bacterium CG10_big_fil_rev_8_21_14_0_10_37_15]|uniref:Heat-inducible transcription repressor HrcA n=1 Tax=Candidatus Yanofskybacteria bacterium CG10_big_fil_rev_8_21_14_0_10_37_15 TaxID=1975097 RepID=A0A2H0R5H4_9BACT|nr:MAG: hypothetical protein COV30_01940 [Candidatus Yanofskybacteria bacterium CG10_big_fil_rev_8_21_14_0_10_37_15]
MTLRQKKILFSIIELHVKSAKPVSSSSVYDLRFNISPATIRNEMKELEEAGYLIQLHTSGGRIPTDKAYRYYVNMLLENDSGLSLKIKDKKKIQQALGNVPLDPKKINRAVAKILSDLSGDLVITGISVKFFGKERNHQETAPEQEEDFFKKGLVGLFENPEFREFEKAFQLTMFFEEFEQMFKFIEKEFLNTLGSPDGLPIQIMIGKESPFRQIQRETFICAKYGLPGDCVGSLTLVGPTRMDYEKNISLIKYITEELNKLY